MNQNKPQVIYLPPYSPDLLPIEHMWSKIKSCLRKLAGKVPLIRVRHALDNIWTNCGIYIRNPDQNLIE